MPARLGLALALALGSAAFAQAPQIASASVVNAASYAQPVTPGSLVSIFGTNLASATASAPGQPLPIKLAGTSVTVNGVPAPLQFVSPDQINAEVPSATSVCFFCVDSATFVVTTAAGSSPAANVPLTMYAPGMFTDDGSGCGQAAALNLPAYSVNSPSNSASPGDYLALFGTGLGPVYFPPPDGASASGPRNIEIEGAVSLGFNAPPSAAVVLNYAGLAPGLVGVDQVNFQIPDTAQQGCSVPVSFSAYLTSPSVTLSIHSGGGQCVDPPVQSYGLITLTKTIASGTSADGETDALSATFPSGPGLPPPQPLAAAPSNGYIANAPAPGDIPIPGVSRACAVPGYTDLSAGTIAITSASQSIAIPPADQIGGVNYQQTLPNGFIAPGAYQVSTSGGPVSVNGAFSIGSPIQIQTASLAPGTVVLPSSTSPFTVSWTGGDPGTLVTVYMVSGTGLSAAADYAQADASTGSVTFDPLCSGNPAPEGNGVVCDFGIPAGSLQVIVDVTPYPANLASLPAQGITRPVQFAWDYRYIFGGLTLGN